MWPGANSPELGVVAVPPAFINRLLFHAARRRRPQFVAKMSVGFALYPEDEREAAPLIQRAHERMYQQKLDRRPGSGP
jgi:GGDEF domain-containing protein